LDINESEIDVLDSRLCFARTSRGQNSRLPVQLLAGYQHPYMSGTCHYNQSTDQE
jgi:hypothetical protein